MDQTLLLTDKVIAALPFASDRQYRVRDSLQKGFLVLVGKRKKSFMAEGECWRDGVRQFRASKKVDEFGARSTRDARAQAKEILAGIGKGIRPGETVKIGSKVITLCRAWERYRDAHMIRKGRSAATIKDYGDHVERLMADWLDKPLGRLGRNPVLVAERHDKITKENGPYIANGAMRTLRAIYNHARKSNLDLPASNPVTAVDWNAEKRRNTGMGADDLGGWLTELFALESPIRREFHLLTLLTGSRPTAIKNVRLEHVYLRQRLLHIPKPKGGESKAFDIPLSRAAIRCIIRVMRLGQMLYMEHSKIWLFPADSASGHLEEHKEERDVLSKWGNDLRQTYRTIAQAAGVSELDIHLLMNHSLPGVNAGYITRDKLLHDHLRKQQERISAIVVERASKTLDELPLIWLNSSHLETKAIKIEKAA